MSLDYQATPPEVQHGPIWVVQRLEEKVRDPKRLGLLRPLKYDQYEYKRHIWGFKCIYTCVGIWPGGEIRWERLSRRAAKGARRPFLCLGGGDYADIEDNSRRHNKVMFFPLDVCLVNSSSLPWASKAFSWKWDEGFINLGITNQCISRVTTFTVTDDWVVNHNEAGK